MPVFLYLLALSASIKDGGANLLTSCYEDAQSTSTLAAGTTVDVRFAVSGLSRPCYRVEVQAGERMLHGYLPGSSIQGLEALKRGTALAAPSAPVTVISAPADPLPATKDSAEAALKLVDSGQPVQALAMLEPMLGSKPNASVLALAGIAAWRADDPEKALGYLKRSLALAPNADLATLYSRIERESQGDTSNSKLYGMYALLRYEPDTISQESARSMLSTIDHEFGRISAELGCTPQERLVAIAQSSEAYRRTTGSAEWNGGQFDGRIRVAVPDAVPSPNLDQEMRRALAHELTHACLSMLGHWPAWLQEGLAQKLSGDTVAPGMRMRLTGLAKSGKLPSLDSLNGDWSSMDTEHAMTAYAEALAAVETYYQEYSAFGIRNLLQSPEKLPQITAALDGRLSASQAPPQR